LLLDQLFIALDRKLTMEQYMFAQGMLVSSVSIDPSTFDIILDNFY
jgi:hypothetical protein